MRPQRPQPCFGDSMRFSATQLRVLQDVLAPPVPELEAPPEMTRQVTRAVAQQEPAAQGFFAGPAPQRPSEKKGGTPLSVLLVLYCLAGGAFSSIYLVYSSGEGAALGLRASAVFLGPAAGLHAISLPDRALARCAGSLCAVLAGPVLWLAPLSPAPVAGLCCLLSCFFGASLGPLRVHPAQLCAPVVWFLCVAASVGPQQYRGGLWAGAFAALFSQAAAASWALTAFELVCVVRPR
jgi:hypothetical protein